MKLFICTLIILIHADMITIHAQKNQNELTSHPNTKYFKDLFLEDFSNSISPKGVWTVDIGVFTASEDEALWTSKVYDNFILDLEFKNAEGTNSGVIFHCTDIKNWIPNSVEVQIADDFAKQWAESPKSWQCGAIFGHLPAVASLVNKPGKWNRMTIMARNQEIIVILNGEIVNKMDMSLWTSAKLNPDGTEIPSWMTTPFAELKTYGHIGLQGKHAGAPIFFRKMKILEIE